MRRVSLFLLAMLLATATVSSPRQAAAACMGSEHLFTFQVWATANKVANARIEVYLEPTFSRPADNLLTTLPDDAQTFTNGNGEATVRLSPGTYYVLVIASGYQTLQSNAIVPAEGNCGSATYSLSPVAPTVADAAQSTAALTFGSIPADDKTTSTLTIYAKNQYGSPLQGQSVTLGNTFSGVRIRQNTTSTDLTGRATWDITGYSVGNAVLTPTVGSVALKPVMLTITDPTKLPDRGPVTGATGTGPGILSPNVSRLRLEGNPGRTDGTTAVTVIVEAKDAGGAPMSGLTVALRVGADARLEKETGLTDSAGRFETRATANAVTSGYVSAVVGGISLEDRPMIRFEPRVFGTPEPSPVPGTPSTSTPPISLASLQGKLIKLKDDGNPATQEDTTVYYVSRLTQRHPFPNPHIYRSWYANFQGVVIVTPEQLASLPLGSAVTYFPGKQLIKFPSDPKVYAIISPNVLRWVSTEELAKAFHGVNWAAKVHDLSEAFATQYRFGSALTSLDGYTPSVYLNTLYSPGDIVQ